MTELTVTSQPFGQLPEASSPTDALRRRHRTEVVFVRISDTVSALFPNGDLIEAQPYPVNDATYAVTTAGRGH